MPSPIDPSKVWRRRERLALTLGCCAALAACVWALAPLTPTPVIATELGPPAVESEDETGLEPLDRTAFAAKLWNPVPEPATPSIAPEPKQAATPPPKLQLIGILHDPTADGSPVLRAALYDPDADTLHIVASGEAIGRVRVASVDPESVRLDVGGRPTILALRDDTTPGGQP